MTLIRPAQILIAPLDWGLGHATRCIPIINALMSQGVVVIIAASDPQMALLREEFPENEFLDIPGYGIRYKGKNRNLVPGLFFRIPGILKSIRREHAWLRELCRKRQIDAIISDNRYGLYHHEIHSVFITHQLFIQSGIGNLTNSILQKLHNRFIKRFSECWVPDFQPPFSLAGILSNPPGLPRIPVKYTGILSRFIQQQINDHTNPLLIIISGPEPERTAFEEMLFLELASYHGAGVVVLGLPGTREEKKPINNVKIYNHLNSERLNTLLNISEVVISKCGYSTVMDLARLRKKAILIPTPGQPEQEYLGNYLNEKKWALTVSQKDFNLEDCMKAVQEHGYRFPELPQESLPEKSVRDLLNQLKTTRKI